MFNFQGVTFFDDLYTDCLLFFNIKSIVDEALFPSSNWFDAVCKHSLKQDESFLFTEQ